MRNFVAATVLVLAVALGAQAEAAPTCVTRAGETVRCGTANAMPVGWRLPPQQRIERLRTLPRPSGADILKLVCALGVFFSLMALLPDFEHWREADPHDDR